jgi:putative nucleotidyltransferase with HDIG domain
MEEKSSALIEYYQYDKNIGVEQIKRLNSGISNCKTQKEVEILENTISELSNIYERSILSSKDHINSDIIFAKIGSRATEVAVGDLITVDGAYESLYYTINDYYKPYNVDSLFKVLDVRSFISPNLLYDKATSELLHKESVNYISPTCGIVYTGQLIVSEGEIITAEIAQLLDSFKAEYINSYATVESPINAVIGNILLILSILCLLYWTIYFCSNSILKSTSKLIFVLTATTLVYTTIALLSSQPSYLFMVPFSLYILFTMAFLSDKFVLSSYTIILLPLIFMIDEFGLELYLMNVVAGAFLLYTFSKFYRSWQQFINILVTFAVMFFIYSAFRIEAGTAFVKREVIFIGIGSILTLALYPFVFIIEKIFSFVSSTKLWEMSDTNNRLLQELANKAPGSFQHSVQVASLAESAARKIGAHVMLAKVGALYHDIGKINNPLCFTENQHGDVNYHESLTPQESSADIIKHVEDGMAIAKHNSIPEKVSRFIASHHGTTTTGYFYTMFLNAGGSSEEKPQFTYPGPTPSNKEEVIVMLADSIEAASRSLKSYDDDSIRKLVENICRDKIEAGQIDHTDITLGEISIIKESFIEDLVQIFHRRIQYPKRKKR